MHRPPALAAALLIAAGTMSVDAALAQQKGTPQKSPPLDQLECRTLLKLDGDERAYTLLYYHGFVSGRMNMLELPAEQLATATDRIIDHCIDRANDKVLAVFEQVRKQK